MGLRFRKSIKIAPGVRLNVGKKSVGVSVGNKYGGVSFNSKTGARARVSAPGTGVSYSTKIGNNHKGQSNKKYTYDHTQNRDVDTSRQHAESKGGLANFIRRQTKGQRVLFGIIFIGLMQTFSTASPPINAVGVGAFGLAFITYVILCLKYKTASKADVYPSEPEEYEFQNVQIYPTNSRAIISTPNFCIVDIETTGLSSPIDKIVEIGILKIQDNSVVDSFSSLVNPGRHISAEASAVNGIYDSDISAAPCFNEVAGRVANMLRDSVVIGHNVTFDLGFIQNELAAAGYIENYAYIDTLGCARHIVKGLPNYKLQTLLAYYEIAPGKAHRASSDVQATYELFKALRTEYRKQYNEALGKAREERERRKQENRIKYAASPLLEKNFCFTGEFLAERHELEAMAPLVGACVRNEVNGKTAYLVKGDVSHYPDWAVARKYGKAMELAGTGKPIKIIDERQYLDIIENACELLDSSDE